MDLDLIKQPPVPADPRLRPGSTPADARRLQAKAEQASRA